MQVKPTKIDIKHKNPSSKHQNTQHQIMQSNYHKQNVKKRKTNQPIKHNKQATNSQLNLPAK